MHLPARIDAILKKIILTLQAASARTHFRGGVMGSNADFMKMNLKPKEFTFQSYPAEPKMGMDPHNFEISRRSFGDRKLHSKNSVLDGFRPILMGVKTDFYQNPILIKIARWCKNLSTIWNILEPRGGQGVAWGEQKM